MFIGSDTAKLVLDPKNKNHTTVYHSWLSSHRNYSFKFSFEKDRYHWPDAE